MQAKGKQDRRRVTGKTDVGKQGERGETKISAGQTKLRTRWKRVER